MESLSCVKGEERLWNKYIPKFKCVAFEFSLKIVTNFQNNPIYFPYSQLNTRQINGLIVSVSSEFTYYLKCPSCDAFLETLLLLFKTLSGITDKFDDIHVIRYEQETLNVIATFRNSWLYLYHLGTNFYYNGKNRSRQSSKK